MGSLNGHFRPAGGYTLIELLVVAAIMVILTVAVVNLFFSTLVGGGKSNTLNELRANGDFAITQMERTIRNGASVTPCVDGVPSVSLIVNVGGEDTLFYESFDRIAVLDPLGTTTYLTASNLVVAPEGAGGLTFECDSGDDFVPPQVTITFTLESGGMSDDFVTTAQLRTY